MADATCVFVTVFSESQSVSLVFENGVELLQVTFEQLTGLTARLQKQRLCRSCRVEQRKCTSRHVVHDTHIHSGL